MIRNIITLLIVFSPVIGVLFLVLINDADEAEKRKNKELSSLQKQYDEVAGCCKVFGRCF